MYRKFVIGSTERGILYKNRQFVRLLAPGTFRMFSALESYSAEVFDIVKTPELSGPIASIIFRDSSSLVESFLYRVSTGPREVAVVYRDARAAAVIGPGQERLFWKGVWELQVKRFDITDEYEINRETLRDISGIIDETKVLEVRVPEQCKGILFESGVIVRELQPGYYGFFRAQRQLLATVLDTRVTALEVSGQEMLTKDKVSLRVNLTVAFSIVDVSKAVRSLSDISGEIYRTAQLALRQAVGEKTLDELLENKEALNRGLASEVSTSLEKFGIEISRIGAKDIILPGDMRILLNQVVEAEKAAQAQNIRRREEFAATRSLLNTARMIEGNPVLLRLKELEAVERISSKIEKLTVYDGLKGVMNGLVKLSGD